MECTEKQVPSGPRDKATACKAPSPGSCSKDTLLFKIPTCGCLNPFSTPKSSQQDLQMASGKPFGGLRIGGDKCQDYLVSSLHLWLCFKVSTVSVAEEEGKAQQMGKTRLELARLSFTY